MVMNEDGVSLEMKAALESLGTAVAADEIGFTLLGVAESSLSDDEACVARDEVPSWRTMLERWHLR